MFVVEMQRARAAHAATRRADGKDGDSEKGEDCPICLERLVTPGAVLTRCGHMFHKHCISQHLSKEGGGGRCGECPICRRSLHEAELVNVMSGVPEGGKEGGREVIGEGKVLEVAEVEEKLEKAIGEIVGEIKKVGLVVKVGQVMEEEVEKMGHRWDQEVRKMKTGFEEERKGMVEEGRRVEQMRLDCLHERTELKARLDEVNEQMANLAKMRRELVEAQQNAKRREVELVADKQRFEDEKLGLRRTKDRLEALIVAKGEGERGRDLRKENERLKREIRRLEIERKEGVGGEEGVKENNEAFKLMFGGNLQKPSSLNRPKAPRRGGGSLSGWAPKKARVQRPGAGIGERKG